MEIYRALLQWFWDWIENSGSLVHSFLTFTITIGTNTYGIFHLLSLGGIVLLTTLSVVLWVKRVIL